MLISTKGRYALQVMCDLLAHDSGGFVPLKEIAARQDISLKYLESITKTLVRGNLIAASSGRGRRLSAAPGRGGLHRGGNSPVYRGVPCSRGLRGGARMCPAGRLHGLLPLGRTTGRHRRIFRWNYTTRTTETHQKP